MKTIYRCQLCGNTVTIHINITHPPTCWNPNKHTGKRVDMNILTPTTDTKRQ